MRYGFKNAEEVKETSLKYNLHSWSVQGKLNPAVVEKAEGIYYYTADGKKMADMSSQLVNLNVGYGNKDIIDAIKEQAEKLAYISPAYAIDCRSKLAEMVVKVAPKNMGKVFFTLGGADANENAIKIAKLVTGRYKIFSRYRAYHGSSFGAGNLTGEPRRYTLEPGIPGFVKFTDPYLYHAPFPFESEEQATEYYLGQLRDQIIYENPDAVAAIVMESVTGSNGIIIPPKGYLQGVRKICDEFGIMMVYDFGVTDGVFYKVLEKAKSCGAMISVHAENKQLIDVLTERYLSEGKTSAWYHYMSRPEFVEGEADIRAIQLAKSLDSKLYIVHLANKEGVQAVERARNEGYQIYAETCPQYLEFTSEVYKRADGRNFVCSPPMKGEESRLALWEAIKKGLITTIATDHCPFQSYEKDWGKDDFTKIPNGCAGIENMYPYMLSAANEGKITFNKAVELCSYNPAKIFGCDAKGAIEVGKDADIVIYDPTKDFTITNDKMHSDCDHTIWEGIKVKGYPGATYSRGKLVFKDGEFLGERGWGKFIKRSSSGNL